MGGLNVVAVAYLSLVAGVSGVYDVAFAFSVCARGEVVVDVVEVA